MEFLICMFLASILTGGRVATNVVHAVKGTTPPHVEKAYIKAAAAANKPTRTGRSEYAADKPGLKDVFAVHWGDAMADAINLHNTRRENKQAAKQAQAAGAPVPARPSLLHEVRDALLQPAGTVRKPTTPPAVTPPAPPVPGVPAPSPSDEYAARWNCPGCGLLLHGDDPGRTGEPCAGCTTGPDPHPKGEPATTPPQDGKHDGRAPDTGRGTPDGHDPKHVPTGAPAPAGTTSTGGDTMAQPATEVNNNEDARIALAAMKSAAAEAAEALAALEVAKAKLADAANGTLEGMSGKRFDSTASTAAAEAADAINVGDLAEWSEKFDTVESAADRGLSALDKYLDAEDLVSANNVDASTLQTN
jgi:hypothetical protein